MEEDKTKKSPIILDWDQLLPRRDDEPPPVLVITTTTTTETKQSPPPPSPMGDDDEEEQKKRDEISQKSDKDLEESITRQRRGVDTVGPRLPDKGFKLRKLLKLLEDERERRKLRRLQKDDDGCEKLVQPKRPYFTSASDDLRLEDSSALPASQSAFTMHFSKKLEANPTDGTDNAVESELSCLGNCDLQKIRLNGKSSPREQHKSSLSSRKSPLQCPSSLSFDVDKHIPSNSYQNGGHCSTRSPHCFEEKSSSSFYKKRKHSEVPPSNDLRPRNGLPFVLVDEEPELTESIDQEEVDERMKDSKIYYPSSDDPESIEICYSDMECLAPKAYLSSTIMNFYIRYLQQPTSSTDRSRCDYHFFNTYFYNKLKEAVLNKNDKESLFVKFRRWWKGVNIFHKAYILLPIHENLHWSLVIICIPDKEDESGPILLHLDSLGLHFSKPIFNNIKSFLREEWNYLNQGEAPLDLPIADRIWKHLPRRIEEKTIAVPQQRNDYDCGLFVLYFMERFIDEAPQRLKKKNLQMFGTKWFKPEEASNLRRKIKKLLVEEFKNAAKDYCVLDPKPLSAVNPQGERIDHLVDC